MNLPHDWAIELPFDKNADMNHGYRAIPSLRDQQHGLVSPRVRVVEGGEGKRIYLRSTVCIATRRFLSTAGWCASTRRLLSVREDISDVVKYGEHNVIAVKVDATKFEGWFCEGAAFTPRVAGENRAGGHGADGIFVLLSIRK